MSYRDPQRVIDDRYQRIAVGINDFFGKVNKGADAYFKKQEKEKKKARKKLDKAMDPYADQEKEFLDQAAKYSDSLSEEEKADYQSMLDDNLLIIRNQLKKDLNNPDLTNSEIEKIQRAGLTDLRTFQKSIQTLQIAHMELEEGANKKYGEAGYLTENKNPEFINVLKDVKDGADFELINTKLVQNEGKGYKLGSAQYGVVVFEPYKEEEKVHFDGMSGVIARAPKIESMIELKKFNEMAEEENFFSTDAYPVVEGFNDFVLGDAMNDNRFVNQVERTDAKGKTVKQNALNPNKLKYYLVDTAAGGEMIDGMFDEIGMQGYLRSKKPQEHTQEAWEAIISDEQVARDLTVDFLVEDAIFGANPGTIYRDRDGDGEVQTLAEGFELEEDALNLFTETADQQ
jgi:hypothetical protein